MRQTIAQVLICLVIGALISLVGAWMCVAWSPLHSATRWPEAWPSSQYWPVDVPTDWPDPPHKLTASALSGFGVRYVDTHFGTGEDVAYPGTPSFYVQEWDAGRIDAGWPFACLTAHHASYYTSRTAQRPWWVLPEWAGGLRVRGVRDSPPWTNNPMPMPYRPLWPPLVFDTLFWGGLIAGMCFGIPVTRRALRRRRGLCLACAYPIGSSPVCSECGKPVTPRAVPLPERPAGSPGEGP